MVRAGTGVYGHRVRVPEEEKVVAAEEVGVGGVQFDCQVAGEVQARGL